MRVYELVHNRFVILLALELRYVITQHCRQTDGSSSFDHCFFHLHQTKNRQRYELLTE